MTRVKANGCRWVVAILAVSLGAVGARQVCAQTAGVNNDCVGNGAGVYPNPDNVHNFTVTGGQVSGAGATLFVDFFLAPASTNDWIDVDHCPSVLSGYA